MAASKFVGDQLPPAVRITAAEVAWLTETWSRQWQRNPTQEELRGLVTDYLREELLAREGRAMGLDTNDTIVRRRLAQKVAFLVDDTARLNEPTQQDLRRYYDAHRKDFQNESRLTFTQVYFSHDKRSDPESAARGALAEIARGTDPGTLGDRLLLGTEMRDADERTISAQLGPDFAKSVLALKPGTWSEPILSGYGRHLVFVSESSPAQAVEFDQAKAVVQDRWREEQQREVSARYFAGLMKKYRIDFDESARALIGPLDGPLPMARAGEEAVR